jgi:hypothetical protein
VRVLVARRPHDLSALARQAADSRPGILAAAGGDGSADSRWPSSPWAPSTISRVIWASRWTPRPPSGSPPKARSGRCRWGR